MEVKRVKKYNSPKYPTLTEIHRKPELLDKVPQRWQSPNKLAMILGMASLLTRYLEAEAPADKKLEIVQGSASEEANVDNLKKTEEAKPKLQFPIFPAALNSDGRGAFGCVAMNPPTFLSESEALDIIHKELVTAGLKLREDVPLSDLMIPNEEGRWNSQKPKKTIGKYFFDYVSEDGSIVIDFLSRNDHERWDTSSMGSSVSSYNFPKLTEEIKGSFDTYNGEAKIVGLFFDPLETDSHPKNRAPLMNVNDNEVNSVISDAFQKNQPPGLSAREKAEHKLKQQIAYFLDHLRKVGKLPQKQSEI